MGGLWLIFIGMFLVVVNADTSVHDAVEEYFLRYSSGGFPVGTHRTLEGLLSLSMVQHCPREERAHRRVREIMRHIDEQLTISPEATVSEALHKMVAANLGRLLVTEHGQLRGLITRSGILRFIQMKTQLDATA